MTNRTEVSFEDFPVTGSITGTFLGAEPGEVSFVGSASHADTSRTADIAVLAETSSISLGGVESASFADTASIVLGGIESATFAVTAAFTETASIATTAETASLAETASFAVSAETASFVESASFADNAILAQNATQSLSASLAETASFAQTASVADSAAIIVPVPSFMDEIRLINIPAAVTPLGSPGAESVGKFNFANRGFSSLGVTITGPDDQGGRPRIALQYSLDNATWNFLNGVDGPYADITGSPGSIVRTAGPVANHVSESKTDVFIRVVTYSGSVTPPNESPTVFAAFWIVSPVPTLL